MKRKFNGLRNGSLFILWKIKFNNWMEIHFPFQISLRKPKYPKRLCPECGKPFDILCAYNTGEGWDFSWNCPDYHNDGDDDCHIEGWYPYLFGVWCTGKDLAKIDIQEV